MLVVCIYLCSDRGLLLYYEKMRCHFVLRYHNFLILVFCLLYHTVSAKLECFPSDREIEYQNDIACDLDVECPKGYGINAVAAKAGYLSQPGSDPPVPISETDDHQWYWICTKVYILA